MYIYSWHKYSMNDLSKKLKVANTTIRRWLARYQSLGPEGLQETSKNLPYSSDLKETVVMDYLSGIGSQMDLCKKYGIKSTRQLRNFYLQSNWCTSIL
jgi:transposase